MEALLALGTQAPRPAGHGGGTAAGARAAAAPHLARLGARQTGSGSAPLALSTQPRHSRVSEPTELPSSASARRSKPERGLSVLLMRLFFSEASYR